VTELFELEWMGGVAEHHFRKARPGIDDFAWETLEPAAYPAAAIEAAQQVWTDLALSEYAAIAAFSEVVNALALARAPLDLIGMTGDFLADEVRHVELASRLVMQLGGAAPRPFEPARLTAALAAGLTPLQRANELALRVGCIAEAFASATAAPIMRATTHPLVRAIYVSILRDEARHRRFGSLYFEWAGERLDAVERQRLAEVAASMLQCYAPLWRRHAQQPDSVQSAVSHDHMHELGWIEPALYTPLAISVVRDQIVPGLRDIGVEIPSEVLDALLSGDVAAA
jgi:hypothetical protein